MPQQGDSPQGSAGSSQSTEAVFTGTVESQSGTQWLISGQLVDVNASTGVAPNIQVGDIVKVEASVSADGAVVALKIESSGPDDDSGNQNSANSNDDNVNDDSANTNDNTNSSNVNSNDDNSNTAPTGPEQEAFGVVEAIADGSITIGGISYSIANFTEFKDLITVGDQVKMHVIVNADGTFTIREIERSTGDDSNSNDNSNGDDSNSNDDNGNDDNSNDDDSNSNDDNSNDDDNSNGDDDDDDDDSNDNDD